MATRITGSSGNDTLSVGTGSNTVDGGDGVDAAAFSGSAGAYMLNRLSSGEFIVSGADGAHTLTNTERLNFADTKFAIDLDGKAGTTAKILGAVGGTASLSNKEYVGIGLSYLDGGMSYQDLILLALNAMLGTGFSNAAEVNLLYLNVVGVLPTTAELDYYTGAIASGQFSQASLAMAAAELDLNKTNINLTGLQQTGIEYSEVGWQSSLT